MHPRAAGSLSLAAAVCALGLFFACSSGVNPPDAIGTTRAGLGCYTDSQCGDDVCNLPLFPGGACVGTCDDAGMCPDDPDAGPPQVCLGAPNLGACLRGCESDGGCIRDGWICQSGPNSGQGQVCLPDCRGDAILCSNAGPDFQCSISDGICRISATRDAGLFGACANDLQCPSGDTCLGLAGQQGDGGFCSLPCSGSDGGAPDTCPSGAGCVVEQGLPDGGVLQLCGDLCGVTSDAGSACQSGLICQGFSAGLLPDGGPIVLSICAP